MVNGLITPGLVLGLVEATEDAVVTQEEFSNLMGIITSIVIGVFTIGIIKMLIESISKRFIEGGE